MLVLVNHAMLKFFSPRLMASQEFAINLVLLLSSQAPTLRPTLTFSITLPSDSLYGCDCFNFINGRRLFIILPFNISLLIDILSLLGDYCTVEGGCMMAPEMLPFKEEVKVVEDLLLLLSMNADNCF